MKTAKKVLAVVLSVMLLVSVLNISGLISVFAADQTGNYITVLEQDFEGSGIADYYSQPANTTKKDDFRVVELVTGEGIGNKGSNTAIKLGYGRNLSSEESKSKPAFNIASSDPYNGKGIGESFQLKPGAKYKLSFYYKIVSNTKRIQIWSNQVKGSLETQNVELTDAAAYKKVLDWTTATNDDYVYVETEITAVEDTGYDLVLMLRHVEDDVGGTFVYFDDITVKELEETTVPGGEVEYVYDYSEQVLSTTFETDAEVKPNSGFYCGTSNATAHALDTEGYKYKNYDDIAADKAALGQHMAIPVVQTGIGNNGSNGVMKLGYDGDASSAPQYRPAFSLRCSMAYNGRNVGQSFQPVQGSNYKVSLYYKVENYTTPVSLWMRLYNGSLTNAAVDSNAESVKLVDITAATDGYVHLEATIEVSKKENLIIFMKAGDYSKVGGTAVYIDDINVFLGEKTVKPSEDPLPDGYVLNATFEDNGDGGKDAVYYGSTSYSNGVAPQPSNNIPNDPRETCLVTGTGVGYNGSTGAIKFGYKNNPDNTNKAGLPVFSVRNTEGYNSRSDTQSLWLISGKTYTLTFYYKAENINSPVDIYVREYNNTLHGARLDTNDSSRPATLGVSISAATNGWKKVEIEVVSYVGQGLTFLMKPQNFDSLAGTAVYIDNISLYEGKKPSSSTLPEGYVLGSTFEDNGDGGKDAVYYGSTNYANGVAPQPSNNIPNDPRETCLVTGNGVGYNGSTGAIKFGYKNNPDNTNKAGLPVFSVRNTEGYNSRSDTQSFWLVGGQTYTLTFYYKAENINSPVDIYMREYDKTLHGARLDTNDSARPATLLASITQSTDGWKKVEIEIVGTAGQGMIFLMKPQNFDSLAGTAVYIDNIYLKLPDNLPKIKFESNGGSAVPDRDVRPEEEFGVLPTPTKDGYVFEGWFNQDFSVAYTEDMICPQNIDGTTFYAKWSKMSDGVKSFSARFEESDYSVTPYLNDGVTQHMHNNITQSASWLKNAEISYSGSGAMRISNDPFYMYSGAVTHGFALVNGDGTRFNVVKGERYKIKFYYYATEPATAHSHISAVVSSDVLAKKATSSQQVVLKKTVHGISDDWQEVEATFEANVTGFVYITLTARISTSEASSRYHTTYVDNVTVDLLGDEGVKVSYYDGTSQKSSSIGKANESITHPVLEVKAGYEFTGWYKDSACTERVTSTVYPAEDTKYYAGYVAVDNSKPTASNASGLVMSFEENELMDAFYGTKQRLTKDLDDMGREIELIRNNADTARTGKNSIKMSELEYHYTEIGFLLYDANNKNGNLYLEPGESYNVSYWVLPNDAFNVLQFSMALVDVSNVKFAVKDATKLDLVYVDPNEYEDGEWIKVTHVITNNTDSLKSLALVAPKEGNNCYIDDIAVNKLVDVEIKFESNGGSAVEPMTVQTFNIVEVVFEPFRDGYEFVGWCSDKELTNIFDFEKTEITGPMTFYAKWKADESSIVDEEENVQEDSTTNDKPDSVVDDTPEKIDNGERPVIDDADPVKQTSNDVDKVEQDKSVNPLVIVAIVCGALALVAGILVLILLLKKKRNKTIIGG